jgi:protein-disulfide isomerase
MPEETKKKDEYFEIHIPKTIGRRIPLAVVILLMLAAYLAGLVTTRVYTLYQQQGMVTDARSAFVAYAKTLKLNTKDFTACLQDKKYDAQVNQDLTDGAALEVNATPTFFVNGRMILGAQPYSLFKQMIDQELSGNRSPLTEEEASGAAEMKVGLGHLPLLGDKNAKVTIVEFSDFQCPFCEAFYTDTLSQLKKEYLDTGKAHLAFRHFPIESLHPNAPTAHEAAECANEQGKFWEYHNALFNDQQTWADLPLDATPKNTP